jgi:hypothetical protein
MLPDATERFDDKVVIRMRNDEYNHLKNRMDVIKTSLY